MTHIQSLAVHEKKIHGACNCIALADRGAHYLRLFPGLGDDRYPWLSPFKLQYYTWHKWIGVTIFVFAVLRVLWRLTHPAPPLQSTVAPWQRRVAYFTHAL